jgi:hypothetical protein
MQWADFKKKWSRYQGKETSAYQGHFDGLCRLLGQSLGDLLALGLDDVRDAPRKSGPRLNGKVDM